MKLTIEQIGNLAKEYIKPFKHQLHLGEEEALLSDLISFGQLLINTLEQTKTK